ncbi:hypothetical protein SCUCBS95973_001906 [Sporothrix curviconia]|uniref:Polyprenal reductase n=1 Tax=Sporothrix curviconia TaxID=1260050 RepID=A0ABP0B2H1_9PEZI
MTLSPASICQASFVGLGAAIMVLTLLPAAMQKHLLDYGARDTERAASVDEVQGKDNGESKSKSEPLPESGVLERTVATVVPYLQVPHSWFISFYVFYLICSAYWAAQWWSWRQARSGGEMPDNLFGRIVARQQTSDPVLAAMPATPMALLQVYVAFGLEALQTGRRLYEYICVFKPSKANMNIAHFLLGLMYYAIMSVAVWVEGSQAIVSMKQHDAKLKPDIAFAADKEALTKIVVGTIFFLLAWGGQFRCHVHLAGLKKYSLPEEGLFRYFVSPHYTCELFLYGALSIVTAPEGRLVNRTLLSSLLFVIASLGVTAGRTKQWYSDKFGAERVAQRWRMIPFLF